MALAKGKVTFVTGAAAGIGRASRLALAREGARAAAVDDHDAPDSVDEWHPDAVAMDQVTPEMTGAEATQEITQQPRSDRSVIIAMAAGVLETDRAQLLAAGCDMFLPKAIDRDEPALLSQSARVGRIVEIHEQLTHISELGDEYDPFIGQARDLARRFEMDEIVAFSDEIPQGWSE